MGEELSFEKRLSRRLRLLTARLSRINVTEMG
jgi:hypothetical protein